jgi:hypothetical protein
VLLVARPPSQAARPAQQAEGRRVRGAGERRGRKARPRGGTRRGRGGAAGGGIDACFGEATAAFTSEALFNRIIVELWLRRALSVLALDRREFAAQLKQRGWIYDEGRHEWRRAGTAFTPAEPEMALEMVGELPQAPYRT